MAKKELHRSRTNRMLGGVLGGLAEYFDTDATLLRLIFIFILIFTGFFPLFVVYIIWWLVVPNAPASA